MRGEANWVEHGSKRKRARRHAAFGHLNEEGAVMKFGHRVKRIIARDAEHLRVTLEFADGVRGTVDLTPFFRKAGRRPLPLEILRGQLFDRCFVEGGALARPNGYELCPDALRALTVAQRRRAA